MAPADVEIFRSGKGPEHRKVHRGDAQKFETEEIKAAVASHGGSTEVEFSGTGLIFSVRKNGNPISAEGAFEKGRFRVFLEREGDSVGVRDREGVRSSLKVTHTSHDGSTGEEG